MYYEQNRNLFDYYAYKITQVYYTIKQIEDKNKTIYILY